jgi:acetyl esterase/lipase
VCLSGRNTGLMAALYNGLLKHVPHQPRIFALEYRTSSGPPLESANPFPAALIDSIAGYHYLLNNLGFKPGNIILSGDSSGGAMTVWLARYLSTQNIPELPPPRGLLLLSPTVDIANTHIGPASSMARHANSDSVEAIISSGYAWKALLGRLDANDETALLWIAPGARTVQDTRGMLSGFPKTFIDFGGAEQTLDSGATLYERLKTDIGPENVVWNSPEDGTHDYLTMPWIEPERTETLKKIRRWIETEIWPH